ncbi:baculoviral IAP repeat-containing protein 3-like isoform X2 [Mytilus californianus]|uniref:baculoviral IAP repeat-containing protein 3-like isoform X2 n=1 Tax=Mytilus californianus TaxID=6549 RepID=UPI002248664F|nr:baculoviral IAP repeat-containing protein 3-like isoform X2 [Mytilus californianus]
MAVPYTDDEISSKKKIEKQEQNEDDEHKNQTGRPRIEKQCIDIETNTNNRNNNSLSCLFIFLLSLFSYTRIIEVNYKKHMMRNIASIKVKWKADDKMFSRQTKHSKTKWIFDNIVKPLRSFPHNVYYTYPFFPQDFSSFYQNERKLQISETMKFEGARFASFSTFPDIPGIYVTRLAAAGFYYTGTGDEVMCHSCGAIYKNWKCNDSAVDIHKRISPHCSFLLDKNDKEKENQGACGSNVIEADNKGASKSYKTWYQTTVLGDDRTVDNKVPRNIDSCSSIDFDSAAVGSSVHKESASANDNSPNLIKINQSNGDMSSISGIVTQEAASRTTLHTENSLTKETPTLGICLDKPKYPKYAVRSIRLDSFIYWPKHLTQSPEEMSLAGFFFTGIDDHCRCFFCGGGLRSWEPGDHPWIEHARWYQNCAFVQNCKGDTFVEDVQMNRFIPTTKQDKKESSGQTSLQNENRKTLKNKDFGSHPAVLSVSEFGYDESLIKRAYDSIQRAGTTDITGTLLLEKIFQLEESSKIDKPSGQQQNSLKETSVEKNKQEITVDPELELSVRSLEEENQNLRDQQTCKICLDEPIAIVFLPCGHLASCVNCAPALRRCPICRAFIKGTVKAILS